MANQAPSTISLRGLSGNWGGTSQLWLHPGADAQESQTTAHISSVAQGQVTVIAYTWEFESERQDGMIICPSTIGQDPLRSVWLDSWHMRNDLMLCEATMGHDLVSLQGSYQAPTGPAWGWRIEIETNQDFPALVIRMTNITPDGEEALAVLAQYEPVHG